MTPPTPSANDLLRFLSKKPQTVNLVVNAVPLTVVATAQVNQSNLLYPLAELTIDNTTDWSEAVAGRLFSIGTAPGTHNVTWGVLRRDAGGSTLYFDAKMAGDPGYARDIHQLIDDNQYISVYDARPAWGWWSSIRNGTFYKFWDRRFTASESQPRPIVRLGPHPRAVVDEDTGLARVTLTADTFYFPGRSYFDHAWAAASGTIISEDADTLVADFPPGCHEVSYEVTDTKGRTTLAYRKVFVNGPGFQPFAGTSPGLGRYRITGEPECVQNRVGCTLTFTVAGAVEPGDLYPGQMFCLSLEQTFADGESLDNPDASAHTFIGYTSELSTRTERGVRETTIRLYSPMTLAAYVPVAEQTIIEKNPPTNWTEVRPVLANVVGYYYYLVALHAPYLLDHHDFDFDEDLLDLKRKAAEFTRGKDLGGHLKQLATWLNGDGVIGSRTDGTTRMLRHPFYMDNDELEELPDQFTWTPGTIRRSLEHTLMDRFETGQGYAGGWARDGAKTLAHKAVAPGFIPSQAPGYSTLEDTTIPYVSDAQAKLRIRALAGYHHARMNPRTRPAPTLVDRNLNVAQAVDVDRWHVFNVPASYDTLGEGWVQERRLPTQVTWRWGTAEGTQITIEWEVLTRGFPGQLIPLNKGGAKVWQARAVPEGFVYSRPMPNLSLLLPVMFVWNATLRLGRSFNFAKRQATWRLQADNGAFVPTRCVELVPDSAYFSDPNNPLEAYVLAYDADAGTLTLYHIPDCFTEPATFDPLETWIGVDDGGFFGDAAVLVDTQTAGYVVVMWRNRAGTHVYRSTDYGATWDAGETFGHADPQVGEVVPVPLGAALYDERLIFTAHEGDQDSEGNFIYFVYTASSTGGSISKINNPTGWRVNPGGAALFSTTNAVVGLIKPEPPAPTTALSPVTFEEGDAPPEPGYPHYTIVGSHGAPTGSDGIYEFAGERQAFADFDSAFGGTGANGVAVNVTVDLTAFYTFDSVTFDADATNVSATGKRTVITVTAQDDAGATVGTPKTIEIEGAWPDNDSYTVTAAEMGLTTEEVWYLVVSVDIQWASIGGSTTATVFLDNIDIDATLVAYETQRALHSLNPSTGTYTLRNSHQLLPFHYFGIAADNSEATCIGRDEDGLRTTLLTTEDSGITWQKNQRVDGVVGCKRRSNVIYGGDFADVVLLFGYDILAISLDGGRTGYNALGDLPTRFDHVGRIDGVEGVIPSA